MGEVQDTHTFALDLRTDVALRSTRAPGTETNAKELRQTGELTRLYLVTQVPFHLLPQMGADCRVSCRALSLQLDSREVS